MVNSEIRSPGGRQFEAKRFGMNEAKKKAGENTMKKFLLGAVGLVAIGIAAPAVAADLPAQTYSKAPVMMPAVYDWSGVYVGVNGGWGTESRCFELDQPGGDLSSRPTDATIPQAPSPAVRSVIAGRAAPGCSAWKRRATGPICAAAA